MWGKNREQILEIIGHFVLVLPPLGRHLRGAFDWF
jgi:hypothetical protein